jgi:hypothetical protein
MTQHIRRPLTISSGLAVAAGLLAVLVVANGPAQLPAIGITVAGLTGIAVGMEMRHRDYPVIDALIAVGGIAGVFAGLGWGVAVTRDIGPKLELLPGLVGLFVLVLGLASVKPGYERWFVSVGAGAILLGVLFSGFIKDASAVMLLIATAATVVTWDLGEQAINMGEQLGRQARTWPIELAHGSAGVLVGGFGVVFAIVVGIMNVQGLPLVGLVALLVAGMVLATALYT